MPDSFLPINQVSTQMSCQRGLPSPSESPCCAFMTPPVTISKPFLVLLGPKKPPFYSLPLSSTVQPSRSLEPPEDPVQTQLHRLVNPNFYGYQDTPWRIFLRKEVPEAGQRMG